MANTKKLIQAAAGSAGGEALNVEEVFSTYLYEGNGSTQTITNDIDLAGEGGLVWMKRRDVAAGHHLYDTERGATKRLRTDGTGAESTVSDGLTSFNSNGFSIGANANINGSAITAASWTFRKAPKFFDVITYTGNGTSGRAISHNLGSTPGCIIIKDTSNSGENWTVYHRGLNVNSDNAPETDGIYLNLTNAAIDQSGFWNDTAPTSTQFTVGTNLNSSFGGGANYVAYLFAHNDGDGDFGPTGDQDIIKCGSFTEVSGSDVTVDLGFEPQWIMIKVTSTTGGWGMYDVMRGWNSGGTDYALTANTSDAEASVGDRWLINPNGFTWKNTNNARDIIYIAIRRGPMAVPESATDVFNIDVRDDTDAPMYKSGFVTDFSLYRDKAAVDDWRAQSRLTGKGTLFPNTTDSESSIYNTTTWDFMNGFHEAGSINTGYLSWMWKRAPNYFDVVAYTGENGMGGQTDAKPHNLGVVPEMIWIKTRSLTAREWVVWVNGFGTGQTDGTGTKEWLYLNTSDALQSSTSSSNVPWGGPHTATTFSTGSWSRVNDTGETYIAYLFASLDGVSKVGSYTGTGSALNIDCGFSSGARFILIKRTDSGPYDWFVWDSERGIVAGNDPRLSLNTTNAEVTTQDDIDPYSLGFTVSSTSAGINTSGGSYIFYAIA